MLLMVKLRKKLVVLGIVRIEGVESLWGIVWYFGERG